MSKTTFEEFTNQYSLSKTLRFELKANYEEIKKIADSYSYKKEGNIKKLVKDFNKIQENFLEIFVHKKDFEENQEIIFKKDRKIKYGWLRSFVNNDFYKYTSDKNQKYYELASKNLSYVSDEFLRWITEWQELTEKLYNLVNTREEDQERKSEIAFLLREFLKRQNFPFIYSFVNSVIDIQKAKSSDDDKKIQEFKKLLSEVSENLKNCEREYLPAQTGGVILHKSSLNYYTLNKTPKEGYKNLKEKKEKFLFRILIKDCKDKRGKAEFWFDRKFSLGENPLYWNLDEAYLKMKDWKAEQKSKFLEAVASDTLSVDNFREKFPLFDTLNKNFEEFYRLTKELDTVEGDDAKKIAQQRGSFFNKPREEVQTKNYYEFCELFKRVAMKRGKLIAEIKAIENEEVQSQLLDSWAVIAEEDDKKSVVIIPRKNGDNEENHKKAHEFLENNKKSDKNKKGDITVYHFKSLTLRALEKLCFKEIENTFAPKLKKEIGYREFPRYKEEGRAENKERYENKMIDFYQKILKSDYAKKYLDLFDFGGLEDFLKKTTSDFKDLQEFESELEKVCYVKVPVRFTKSEFSEFTEKFNAKTFEMTTRSIAGNKKKIKNTHAKYWRNFWSDENIEKNHITRLNPEMSIFYREEIKKKSNELRENRTTEIHNRFSKPRLTLAITITFNADAKKTNLQFKTVEDIKNHIDDFNEKFNKKFFEKNADWVYGIDRGLKELATLNIVKFLEEKNEFGVSKPKEFAKIPVYRLKDENALLKDESGKVVKNAKGEDRKIIDNISEVLEEDVEPDSKLFEPDTVSSIDLTEAKLIKGHIILNGDKKTYLKLKELSAKRRIFELSSTGEIDTSVKFIGKKVLSLAGHQIYWLLEWQRQDKWKNQRENLKYDLLEYIVNVKNNIREKDLEQRTDIEKINHLRDAITANMVGILFHLQTSLNMPGFIGLENMDIVMKYHNDKIIDEHFQQSNEDISRRLEWSLYRKFANNGNVPSQIKESILLRDDFKTYQVGILKFVKIGGTSRGCPNCPKEWSKKCEDKCCKGCEKCKENNDYSKNKNKNIYICKDVTNCGFSTKKDSKKEKYSLLEKNLHNSDEVAAYNVAKNAFDNIY